MSPHRGHVPLRTCVGCRRQRPQPELVRLVAQPAGPVILDGRHRSPGRGAYLCRDTVDRCLQASRRRRSLSRSLRVGDDLIDYSELIRLGGTLSQEEDPSPR